MKNPGSVKKYGLIGLVLSIVWLVGCQQRKPALDFERLAMQMPQQPDSVLQQLQEVTDLSAFSEADRALYYVLLTEAQDKCYVEHTSDSLISWAADYFQRKDDRVHYAKALYLKGRIYEDWQQVDRADSCWFRALEVGKQTDDYPLLYRIVSGIGSLYAYQNMAEEAMVYFQQALQYAEAAHDSSSISYAHSYIARIFSTQKEWDSAANEYEKSVEIAQASGTNKALQIALQELMGIYTRKHWYDRAESLLNQLRADTTLEGSGSFCLVVGDYYRHVDDTVQAIPYLKKAVRLGNPYTASNANLCLSYLYKEWNRPDLAIYYDSLYHACRDSFRLSERPVQVKTAEADYRQEQAETKLKGMKSRFGVVVLVGCVAVSVLMLILYRRRRQREQSEREIHRLQSRLDQERSVSCHLQEQIRQTLYEQEIQEKLAVARTQLEQIRQNGGKPLDEEQWKQLFFLLEHTDFSFMQRLRTDFPLLHQEDFELCVLVRFGFDNQEALASHLAISLSGLKKRKQRLKKRLGKEAELAQRGDLERFIRSL